MSSPLSVWENYYGSSHVDFDPDTAPPLEPGRFFDPGVNGGVYEINFNGATLAWKYTADMLSGSMTAGRLNRFEGFDTSTSST